MDEHEEAGNTEKNASGNGDYFWLTIPLERQIYYTRWIGPMIRDKVVADLGCSWGSETLFLGAYWKPRRIIGIDNYLGLGGKPEHEEIFRDNIRRAGVSNVEVRRGDAFDLPLEKGSVDVILVSQAMHHFFDSAADFRTVPESEIAPMARKVSHWREVLAPDGMVLIRDTYRFCLPRYLAEVFPRFGEHVNYRRKQQPQGWERILRAAGFRLEELRPYVPFRFRKFPRFASLRPVNFFLNTHYLMQFGM